MRRSVVVFAPSPLLTITVEAGAGGNDEIHLHAGGQGFWVARMAALLGARVRLCSTLGGEPGAVLRGLIARENVELLATECQAPNGVYVHVRREGTRQEIARTHCRGLSRHETDELYGVAFSAALDDGLALLTGTDPPDVLEHDIYRRLARDLRSNGVPVIADLTGPPLRHALRGGVDVLKISEEELLADGLTAGPGLEQMQAALRELHAAGAQTILLSRAERPALVFDGAAGRFVQLSGPRVEAIEPRGTGDSMFAALAVSLAGGEELEDALRMATAAGCLNATRHGLGTGTRQEIEQLMGHVEIEQLTSRPPSRSASALGR
ncbi:MAG TPA: PfkB family carbohydrate kinase [Solirubrobacteraceae bacterium]|nr:PfkB family carbohydrate kinase [Solirubrobacteraceae bacterium]